jgi:hypothetical protein
VQHSEQLDKIAPALVAAQKAMGNAVKSSSNPHFRSTYANLGDVWNAAEKALADNALAVTQGVVDADEAGFTLVSTLWHTSGQWISEGVRIPLEKPTAQGAGSGITYGRRYGLEALLGIVSEDDDGNAASGKTVTREEPRKADPPKTNGQPPRASTGKVTGKFGDKHMPFGKFKGIPLGELDADELRRTVSWCRDKDAEKFKDLIVACESVANMKEAAADSFDQLPEALVGPGPDEEDLPF